MKREKERGKEDAKQNKPQTRPREDKIRINYERPGNSIFL